jgi:hypothetical protein
MGGQRCQLSKSLLPINILITSYWPLVWCLDLFFQFVSTRIHHFHQSTIKDKVASSPPKYDGIMWTKKSSLLELEDSWSMISVDEPRRLFPSISYYIVVVKHNFSNFLSCWGLHLSWPEVVTYVLLSSLEDRWHQHTTTGWCLSIDDTSKFTMATTDDCLLLDPLHAHWRIVPFIWTVIISWEGWMARNWIVDISQQLTQCEGQGHRSPIS